MTRHAAELFVILIEGYGAAGVAFALLFVSCGVTRTDPMAASSPWTFRLLILPGCVIFWPLLLVRWASGSVAPPVESTAHRLSARGDQ